MRRVAEHPGVRRDFPVLSEALLASASPQVRNMASIGGNLLQRTRCGYFRDAASPCNKRVRGSGCPAITGQNRDTRSWAAANTASPPTLRTWRWR